LSPASAGTTLGAMNANPTAAVLIVGNEILSGRTQDANSTAIARFLAPLGIDLMEIRAVGDDEDEIVAALNALRARYTHVFTTGGIGPTHDDITADAVAKAFGVGIDFHPEALALLAARYDKPSDFNDMRKRMARIPFGATLIKNRVSAAPGFQLGNVFVMAGVPMIMQAMLEEIAPRLARGHAMHSTTISARIAEGVIAGALAKVQAQFPNVAIGSYPFYGPDGFGVHLVARGRDASSVENASQAIAQIVRDAGVEPYSP
jgi:molybdenum cofactor synthesis domain-containing protein